MWSYYGAKTKIIDLYPAPKYDLIIEPFAGSARYALKYFNRNVLLVDCRPAIVDTWHYLQSASKGDILGLPEPAHKQLLSDFNLSPGERLLVGWLSGRGSTYPRNIAQARTSYTKDKKAIAGNLDKIRHWKIKLASFTEIKNQKATWFIDPPYMHGGSKYRTGKLDYDYLSAWCQSRIGQVMVCENSKADWMEFYQIGTTNGSRFRTTEVIWMNDIKQLGF